MVVTSAMTIKSTVRLVAFAAPSVALKVLVVGAVVGAAAAAAAPAVSTVLAAALNNPSFPLPFVRLRHYRCQLHHLHQDRVPPARA